MDPDWGTAEELGEFLWQPHVYGACLPSAPEEAEIEGNDSEQESDGEALDGECEDKPLEDLPPEVKTVCLESRPFGFEVRAADGSLDGQGAVVQEVDPAGPAGQADMSPGSFILSVNEKAVSHLPNNEIKQCLDEEPLPVLLGLGLPPAELKRKGRKRNPVTICTARCRGSYRVVREALEHLGWREVVAESRDTSVVWLEHSDPTSGLAPVQTMSRIDAFLSFCRKSRLAQCLNPWAEEVPDEFDFWPKSWVLPHDAAELEAAMTKSKDTFIAKPSAGSQGKGIVLARKWKDFGDLFQKSKGLVCEYVVQRYIADPCLLDGLKFDLRLYILVTSVVPLRAYLFKEGLARFCTVPYQPPKEGNLQDACMHLTNFAVNAKSQGYQTADGLNPDEGSKRSVSAVFKQIQQEYGTSPEALWQTIAQLSANTLQALRPGLVEFYAHEKPMPLHPLGAKGFQIIGLDVMLDNELKPMLLELNANPSLSVMQPGPKEDVLENPESPEPPAAAESPPPPPQQLLPGTPDRGVARASSHGQARPASRSRGSAAGSTATLAAPDRRTSMRKSSRQRLGMVDRKPSKDGFKTVTSELDLEIKRSLVIQALLLAKPASQVKVARLRKLWRQEGPSSQETLPLDDSGIWVLPTKPSKAEKLCPDAEPETCPAFEVLDLPSLASGEVVEYAEFHLQLYRLWGRACGLSQDSLGQAGLLKLLERAGLIGSTGLFPDRVSGQLWLARVWRDATDGNFGLSLPQFVLVAGRLGRLLLAGCTDPEPSEEDGPSQIQGVEAFAKQVLGTSA